MHEFDIPDEVRATAESAFDAMLTNWGKPCLVVYPGVQEQCNCVLDPIGAKQPIAERTGGRGIPGSTCQVCKGSGTRISEPTEIITLYLVDDPKVFASLKLNLQLQQGQIAAKGFMRDAPKLLKMTHIIAPYERDNILDSAYMLASSITHVGNIVQGKYFWCILQK